MIVIDLIEIKHLKGEQKELAETIGIEAYRKLLLNYSGDRLFISRFDTIVSYNKEELIRAAIDKFSEAEIISFFRISKREFERIRLGCK